MELYREALNRFQALFDKAKQADIQDPTAMSLATVGKDGQPSVRIVLMKDFSEAGFTFYTNLKSIKGNQLDENPKAGLCFYWVPLESQIRIDGSVEKVSPEEADRYWLTRPRDSQIGAWASQQSDVLDKRESLLNRFEDYKHNFGTDQIKRPPHWSGYRLMPESIEFWAAKPSRLHERTLYKKTTKGWTKTLLYP